MRSEHFQGIATQPVNLDYLLYLPKDYENSEEPFPLVFFLHGAGERGSAIEKLTRNGLPKKIAAGEDFPFIMIAPQCSEDTSWAFDLRALSFFVMNVKERYRVDSTRIYLTGLSMGGYGAWHLAEMHPRAFAAVVPICGGTLPMVGFPERIKVLKDVPIWAFHGQEDPIVPVSETIQLVEALRSIHGNVKATIYPGVKHDSWNLAYEDKALWEWLLSQRNHHPSFK